MPPELQFLAIEVNDRATGEVAPVLIVDAEVHLSPESFEKLRIRLPDVPAVVHQSGRYYPLSALSGSEHRIVEREQKVSVSVPSSHLVPVVLGAERAGPPPPASPGPGGFLNYDLLGERVAGENNIGGLFEVGAFAGPFVALASQTVREVDDEAEYIRLDSTLIRDFPERRETVRLGDSINRAGDWGRPVRFGGLQFGTNFATQPNFVTFPTVDLSGDAALPSSVDVLVNDSLRFSDDLPSGPFEIENLPVVTGAGEVTAVVRDVLGRETVISQAYYTSPSLLREGLHDYSIETGFLRRNFGADGNDYESSPFVSGTYRYGFSDRFTGEGHGELDEDRQALGVSAAAPLATFGVLSGAAAGSFIDADPGGLFQLGFEHLGRDFGLAAFGQVTVGDYMDFGVEDDLRSADAEGRLRLSLPFGRLGTLGSSYIYRGFEDDDDEHLVTATYTVRLGDYANLNVTGLANFGANDEQLVSVNISVPLGTRASVSGQVQFSDDHSTLKTLEAQSTPPLEGGFGGRASFSDNGFTRTRGELSHTSRYGVFSGALSRSDGDTGTRLGAVGGLAFADGGLFLSRRINDSFAIASVPGQADVQVYSENRPIGRTDSDGQLLVHNLRAYDANRIGIEPRDLPVDAELDRTQAIVVPRYRSGVTVEFAVDDARSALFSARLQDGSPVPPGAAVRINGGAETFPVGLDGQFVARGAQLGDRFEIDLGSRSCGFVLTQPVPDEPLPVLGPFTCVAGDS